MDENNNLGRSIDIMQNSKFKKRKTKKIERTIRKAMVLNELEKEKAKGIRKKISSVLAFLDSGEPKLPILRDDSDLDEELGQKFVRKLIEVPLSLLYLPFVAAKMGIKAIKLKKWLNQKKDLFYSLKVQHLFDNIEDFSDEIKNYYHLNNTQEFFDHVLGDYKQFPSEYNNLIAGMGNEYREVVRMQREEDSRYGRVL